jgi:hypothetical protein
MMSADDRAPRGDCDADPRCGHAPCFQVRLEGDRPRQASACAYHVADVIQALRAWAGAHGVSGGQLIILAIEQAAGGRQPGSAGTPERADQEELHGFPFTTVPLLFEPGTETAEG